LQSNVLQFEAVQAQQWCRNKQHNYNSRRRNMLPADLKIGAVRCRGAGAAALLLSMSPGPPDEPQGGCIDLAQWRWNAVC
jgi:hypothetical protein